MSKLLLAAALVAQGILISGGIQAQDLRITRAIFGTAQGSADVTPIVTLLALPGFDEVYVASKWLEVDPAVGRTKELVIFYEYRGAPHVLTATEFSAISRTVLIEHANPVLRRRPVPNDSGIVIINALFGQNRNYQDVTTSVSDILRRVGETVVINDANLLLQPTAGNKVLIVNYSYQGIRITWSGWAGTRVSRDALVAHADSGGQTRFASKAPPEWLKDAQPFPPMQPGTPGPGGGRASRRELGVSELLRAVAELEAFTASDRSAAVTTALAATKTALVDALAGVGYPYPPEGTPPAKAQGNSSATYLANAVRSLKVALDQISAANTGRGRGAAEATVRTIAEINKALAALR